MTHLLLLLVLLACLGISAAWVAENPGSVTLYWFDYRIDTSLAFLLLVVLLCAMAATICYNLLHRLFVLPSRMAQSRSLRTTNKALTELTHSVAALAASDLQSAQVHTKKAEKLLGITPLTLLLSAQIARSQGDTEKTQALLEKLLEHEETEYLAARYLSDAAGKQAALPRALSLAERAHSLSPRDENATLALVSLHLKMNSWPQAMRVLETDKGLTREQKRRYKGIVRLAEALALADDGRHETALIHAKESLGLLPNFAPGLCCAARQYVACGQVQKAVKLLSDAYRRHPHNQVGELLNSLATQLPTNGRKKVEALLASHLPENSAQWRCRACDGTQGSWQPHCAACGTLDSLAA